MQTQVHTGVMAGGYLQVDETPIDYLEPGHGRTKQGYLWTGKDSILTNISGMC